MDKEEQRQSILNELEPLFEQAEREGLWFYTSYQECWFTPEELRVSHQNGSFIWSSVNWQLRKPQEYVEQLLSRRNSLIEEVNEIDQKVEQLKKNHSL